MFFTMFLVIDYVINLRMIMRIFPSVILISHFNISCDSKFIFLCEKHDLFFDEYPNMDKKSCAGCNIGAGKNNDLFIYFLFCFWVFTLGCCVFKGFYVVKLFLFSYKDRKISVFSL